MGRFLKKGRVVVVLQGRFAGKKAVILKSSAKTKKYPFGHAIVAGISRAPRRVTKKMSKGQIRKKSSVHTFVKVVNHMHLMPTRYMFDTKRFMKNMEVDKAKLDAREGRRKKLRNTIRQSFERAYFNDTNPKHRWFFRKLHY